MIVYPGTFIGNVKSKDYLKSLYDKKPEVYVPTPRGLDQIGSATTFAPGALVVDSGSGPAMVALYKRRAEVWWDRSRDHDFWMISFFGIPYIEFGFNFRKSQWGELGNAKGSLVGRRVVFDPSLLLITEEQDIHQAPEYKSAGLAYSTESEEYKYWGLIPGQSYLVEYVYPEPYIKVEGVPLVMSAEPWRLDE